MSRAANVLAIAVVILLYGFFGSVGTMRFSLVRAGEKHTPDPSADHYARLGEAFIQGNTYLSEKPDPRLANLKDPYDPAQRDKSGAKFLWDASYYKDRYYLYFTPLPVLLLHVPIGLVTGRYPDDVITAGFFASWALIAAALFVTRAFRGRRLPVWFYILVVGLGHIVPYTLVDLRVYEVAAIATMAMSASWALALLRLIEERTPRAAAWMTLWLGLAIASRPPLALLVLPSVAVLFLVRKNAAGVGGAPLFVHAIVPLLVVGGIAAAYNAIRFGNPLEFGMRYQLTWQSMQGVAPCSFCNRDDMLRFVNAAIHYQFWPVRVVNTFPFVDVIAAQLDPTASITTGGEPVIGVFVVNPLALIATAAAVVLAASRQRSSSTIAAMTVMAGAWLLLLGISTCKYVVDRYSLDFMLLMVLASVVCIENAIELAGAHGVSVRPLRACAIALCTYSLILAILLGFEGRFRAFHRYNPDLLGAIARGLGVGVR